jgi:hypothetical protein
MILSTSVLRVLCGVCRILKTITANHVEENMAPDTPGDSNTGATIKAYEESNEESTHTHYDNSPSSVPPVGEARSSNEPGLATPNQPSKRAVEKTSVDDATNEVKEEAIKQRARTSIRERKDFDRVVDRERSEIYDDLAYASVGVPRLHKQWEHKYFKILVCGESGLGMHPAYEHVVTDPEPHVCAHPSRGLHC